MSLPSQSTIARLRALTAAGHLDDYEERAAIFQHCAADVWPTKLAAEGAALDDVEFRLMGGKAKKWMEPVTGSA